MAANEELVPVFMPALELILLNAEDKKGSPLTEEEVLKIRGKSTVVMMKVADAEKMHQSRGYRDIDPENCWHDFQKLRDSLGRKPSLDAGPRFNQVPGKDAAFEQSILDALASLTEFRKLIALTSKGAMPLVKTRIVDGKNAAFMWLSEVREHQDGFAGVLFETPRNFTRYKAGDVLPVPASEVMDWMVNDNGCLHGGFSIRLMRERKPENERSQYDKYIGVKTYAPLPQK